MFRFCGDEVDPVTEHTAKSSICRPPVQLMAATEPLGSRHGSPEGSWRFGRDLFAERALNDGIALAHRAIPSTSPRGSHRLAHAAVRSWRR